MPAPILYPVNLLELGTAFADGAAPGFPHYRLFDRGIDLPWRDNATGTRTVSLDQGAGGTQTVGAVILGPNHNLAGVTLNIKSGASSPPGTTRHTFVPVAGAQVATFPGGPFLDRWWLEQMVSTVVAP